MATSSGNQSLGRGRRGRDLPVLRWLQVGTAATGLSAALLAAPAVANADEGNPPSGGSSTTNSTASSRGTAGAARAHSNTATTTRSATGSPGKRTAATPSASATSSHTGAATSAAVVTRPTYPAPITAPVTEKAIVTEALTWAGMKGLGSKLPVPDAPVSDLVAAAWVGVRRFHYTYFNSRPTLSPTSYTQDLDTGVITGNLGGRDADGDVLTYKISTAPKHGTLTVADDGTYTYTPDAAYAHAGGTEKFGITVEDNSENPWHNHTLNRFLDGVTAALARRGLTNPPAPYSTDIVTVAIGAVNHAPTITATAGAADPETGTRVVTATATDPDGDATTLAVTAGPGHGTLTALSTDEKTALGLTTNTAAYRYTPDTASAHTGGTDAVSFTATDSRGATTQTSLTLATASINHAPTVALTVSSSDPNTGTVKITPTISDTDGDAVTLAVTSPPANGVLTANADGTYTFTPTAGFTHIGITTSIGVTVTDSYGATAQATAPIVVTPINHAPTVSLSTATATVDPNTGARLIILTTNDRDGDPVTVTASAAGHGTLTELSAAEQTALGLVSNTTAYRYTPDTAYAHTGGTDTITFTATDSYGASSQTPVTINVAPINHAPTMGITIGPANLQTGVRLITVTVNDSDGDAATAVVSTGPTHGTLTNNGNGTYTYTPDINFAAQGGTETIAFKATDSLGATRETPVTFIVTASNHAPTVGVDVGVANANTGSRIIVTHTSDTDGDAVTVAVTGAPSHGTLTVLTDAEKLAVGLAPTVAAYRYAPSATYAHTGGTETIAFGATDSRGAVGGTVITFTVDPINHDPTAEVTVNGADATTGEVTGTVAGSDSDDDGVTYSAPTTTAHGTVTINPTTGVFTYTPSDEARQAAAGATSAGTITLSDPARVTQGTFAPPGWDVGHNYIATFFTATNTQTYTLRQTSAPVDTMMLLYSGTFDPTAPYVNLLDFNDDSSDVFDGPGCGGNSGLCPKVTADLAAGQQVILVVTTYSAGDPLGLPQAFESDGPGGFSSAPTSDSVTVTVSDGHGGSITTTVTVPITPAPSSV